MKADQLERVLGLGGLLSRGLPSYEARPPQLAMARKVAEALQGESRLVVEAGTGTGKTLAYLAPAVLSGLKVVVSTGTKTLQEQIVGRDLPLLLRLTGLDLRVAALKGIGNYLCLRKLSELRRSGALLLPDPLQQRLLAWAETTRTGDRAELTELPDRDPLWAEVSPTLDSRIGPRCPFFEDCFITRARRRAAAARVVVVNHHLLFADLSLRQESAEASVIPAYEALILDEAHQLEEVATGFFGHSVSGVMVAVLCRDCRRTPALGRDEDAARLCEAVEQAAQELMYLLDGRLAALPARGSDGGAAQRVRLVEPPLAGPLTRAHHVLDSALDALARHLERVGEKAEELAHLQRRADRLREGLCLFSEEPDHNTILWAERRRRGLSLHASPVEVGPLLRGSLLRQPIPMVFTSATLAVGRGARDGEPAGDGEPGGRSASLAYFRQRVGLDLASPAPGGQRRRLEELLLQADGDAAREAGQGEIDADADLVHADLEVEFPLMEQVLASPFDFARQALLYLPRDLPLPSADAFLPAAGRRILELLAITRGRALVLFTSHRNLEATRLLLQGRLPFTLLCQGDRPRTALLEQFRSDVGSVLLATASFWEGVDVVGEALSLVIMDKLPFAVPDDPLTAARLDHLRARGLSPFSAYQLPQAALSLKQGFGRLIRHRDDRGVVAILDRRILEKGYGRVLLRSLPACPRTEDLRQVAEFMERER